MHYVEVTVASAAYHGKTPLTYASPYPLKRGAIVVAPMRSQQAVGVVVKESPKPPFDTKVLTPLPDLPPLPEHLLKLLEWMPDYYPSPMGAIAQHFLPKNLPKKSAAAPASDQPIVTNTLPPLTDDQRQALEHIHAEGLHLLHGETGSGKTRVYIELTRRALAANASAIILTPEISLTSQLAKDFRNTFGERVVVMHSRLGDAKRRALWLEILERDEPTIVVGPRSALFMPLKRLGLIVVDEAHEPAYKQDSAPYYHTTVVASKLASLARAPIILGSATPLISDYFVAEQKNRPIVRMRQTAAVQGQAPGRLISVVDLRDKANFSKSRHLSDELLAAISQTLARNEQTLLFLNRRGTARIVFCQQCGWQSLCPHCDLPLVYHGDAHRMRCHTCDFSSAPPASCPDCGSVNIIFRSIGTKAIADEVARLFPDAHVARFDSDNKKADSLGEQYEQVHNGAIDILVGTQTLAKGLDLPRLSLAGVVVADTGLYLPDFSAQERTFQLLWQVVGRVGRGHTSHKNRVIIQTYNPDSPMLGAVINQDWRTFYNNELAERKAFLFPPFCYLLKLVCRRATTASAEKNSQQFAAAIARMRLAVSIDGPAPAFHEKSQGKFAWQLVVKSKNRKALLQIVEKLPSGWSYDLDPIRLT